MEGRKFIETIRLDNILSFGPNEKAFPLEPLNVLIGPNASGKSNLIEALSILASAPRDIQAPIREGGGVREWLWKGSPDIAMATVDVTIKHPGIPPGRMPLRYRLSFTESSGRFRLIDECVEEEKLSTATDVQSYSYYSYQKGSPVVKIIPTEGDIIENIFKPPEESRLEIHLPVEKVIPDQSILSQLRDVNFYPELTYLGSRFEHIAFYHEWNVGHHAPARHPQATDLPHFRLLQDGSNLSLILSGLRRDSLIREQIADRMRDFYPSFKDLDIVISGGMAQIVFHEEGLRHSVPSTRLSAGSLRFLCLLAVLCHPNLPEVVCVEEPELGLHPDIIPEVAKLLVEASKRTQIFVTTHSDILVDALTDTPEAVVVCEKVDGATQLRRLDSETLKPWLEKYRLGELWTSGELGGNRW